jgi:3-hydroxybutyryl-CoA dehydrogenase
MAERIGVIGAGRMGQGIAQVFALAGARVRVFDTAPEALRDLRPRVETDLEARGLPLDAVENVEPVSSVAAAAGGAEMVIEAVPEDLELKRAVLAELAVFADADAVLASATSTLAIGALAKGCTAADRVVGTHWWDPPAEVPLVEVIEHGGAEPWAVRRAIGLIEDAGKAAVHVHRDVPGAIGERLQQALWREAFALLDAGVCEPEEIDTVVRAGFGARLAAIGPIENADLVGLDLTAAIHTYLLPHLDASTEPKIPTKLLMGTEERWT